MLSLEFSHLGIAVADMDKALSVYRELFGFRIISGPFDDPIQKASVCFVGTGQPNDVMYELVAPLDEASSVHKTLARGVGAYHVCYKVDDIDRTLSEVRANGCIVVAKPAPAVAFEGRRIAWFYTPTQQLVEVMEK
jgi:methylmalonyl-CoA/ethylmalonyl-CoA epimerase